MPFGASFLIQAFGWRGAFLALGVLSLAIMVPLALLMREPPRSAAGIATVVQPSIPLSPGVVVIWLSAAVLLCCFTMSVPLIIVFM